MFGLRTQQAEAQGASGGTRSPELTRVLATGRMRDQSQLPRAAQLFRYANSKRAISY